MRNLKITPKLFISSASFVLLNILVAYFFVTSIGSTIEFAEQEKRGNAYQKPLTHILARLAMYETLASKGTGESNTQALNSLAEKIEGDFDDLKQVNQLFGEALLFTPDELNSRDRAHLTVTSVYEKWKTVTASSWNSNQALVASVRDLITDIRGMISHAGDTSNLILDPDLDSYYLMDATLLALPQTLDRLGVIGSTGRVILSAGFPIAETQRFELMRLASMLKESDWDRATADFTTVFSEDANFYGVSESLEASIQPKLHAYAEAMENLISLMHSMAHLTSTSSPEDWENAVYMAISRTMELWDASVAELDVLLDTRIHSYRNDMLTKMFLLLAGLVVASVCFMFVARSISRPLVDIQKAMSAISERDYSHQILHTEQENEIGEIARTLEFFRDTLVKSDRLEEEKTTQEAQIERQNSIQERIKNFEKNANVAISTVAQAATELQKAADSVTQTISEMNSQSNQAASASETTSSSVQTVASAAEEMTASVHEISSQIQRASSVVHDAVSRTESADRVAHVLSDAANSIGNVVQLINDIAEQINLLALNATIESARAGEAGKGFAVVASEVKNLANQTTKATDSIAGQINGIQEASGEVLEALRSIKESINLVNGTSNSIASAIEQQSAVTNEIASNMHNASDSVQNITLNIGSISEVANSAYTSITTVSESARTLSDQADHLKQEVQDFIKEMEAA